MRHPKRNLEISQPPRGALYLVTPSHVLEILHALAVTLNPGHPAATATTRRCGEGWVASPTTVSFASEFAPGLEVYLAVNHERQYEAATVAVGIRQRAPARVADKSRSNLVRFVKHDEQPIRPSSALHFNQQGQGHCHSLRSRQSSCSSRQIRVIIYNLVTFHNKGRLSDICRHFRRTADIIVIQGTALKGRDDEGQAKLVCSEGFWGPHWRWSTLSLGSNKFCAVMILLSKARFPAVGLRSAVPSKEQHLGARRSCPGNHTTHRLPPDRLVLSSENKPRRKGRTPGTAPPSKKPSTGLHRPSRTHLAALHLEIGPE